MSSDSDDDMPLARANGRGKFRFVHISRQPKPHHLASSTTSFAVSSPEKSIFSITERPISNSHIVVSEAHISKAVDSAMDRAGAKSNYAPAGVSIRNGPVTEDKMDVD